MTCAHCFKRVDAMDHFDSVAVAQEGPAQAVHIGRISAEAVRSEERCDHAELHLRFLTAGEVRSGLRLSKGVPESSGFAKRPGRVSGDLNGKSQQEAAEPSAAPRV